MMTPESQALANIFAPASTAPAAPTPAAPSPAPDSELPLSTSGKSEEADGKSEEAEDSTDADDIDGIEDIDLFPDFLLEGDPEEVCPWCQRTRQEHTAPCPDVVLGLRFTPAWVRRVIDRLLAQHKAPPVQLVREVEIPHVVIREKVVIHILVTCPVCGGVEGQVETCPVCSGHGVVTVPNG